MKNIAAHSNQNNEHQKVLVMKLLEISDAVIFNCILDDNCRLVYISENVSQFGYTSDDFLSHKINYKSIIHEADIDSFLSSLEKNLESKREKFSLIHRIITADARIRWLDVKFLVERDDNGIAQSLYGALHDITDIIEKENKVKLLAQALEQSNSMVFITDNNGIITYVNDSVIKHSGYS